MESLNEQVRLLHQSYCESMAIEPEDLPMTLTFECWWLRASNSGVTCDHVRVAVKERLKFNRSGSYKRGVELRHLIRSDEDVAIVLNEYAAWKSSQRKVVYSPNKAQALRDAGLPDTPETPDAKPAGEILNAYISGMKQAVDDATRKAQ